MKRVVDSQMVAHLWAHQTQSDARNAKSSMFFEGDTIYSYGSHFPMARHFKGVVLVNDGSYSITTSKHQQHVHSAISNKTSIYITNMFTDKAAIDENFKYFTSQINKFMKLSIRARLVDSKNWYLNQAQNVCNNANAYSKLMGRTRSFSLPDTEKIKAAIKATRELEKLKRLQLVQDNADKMAAWENGDNVRLGYGLPVCLRRSMNDTIQTSLGAKFPVSHGKRVYQFAKKCRDNKTSFQRNGEKVRIGVFQIDSISVNGSVKAGCHNVTWETIERFAKRMEW